jgi:hypothetical protein
MPRLAVVLLAAAVVAGCSNDGDGGSKSDISAATASLGDAVNADGDVVGVSPTGTVVVQRDEELCTVALDGADQQCFDVPGPVASLRGSSFSPDGTMLAFGGDIQTQLPTGTGVSVIDLTSGKLTTLDQVNDAERDFAPEWVDDTTVAFLRITDDQALQIVRVAVNENKPDVHVVDGLTARDAAQGRQTWVAGAYTVASVKDGDEDTTLTQIAPDGSTSELGRSTGSLGVFGATSSDRNRGVFLGDLVRLRDVTTTVIDGSKTSTIDVVAASAAVSPDGSIVATTGQDGVSLHSFDGKHDRVLDPGEGQDAINAFAMVWTADDQIVLADPGRWQVVTVRNG